ncbi:hypothetical protein A2U01_0011080, partial [Trifolium medium]|nr:hypothetical protein [Trifolium medium]
MEKNLIMFLEGEPHKTEMQVTGESERDDMSGVKNEGDNTSHNREQRCVQWKG